MKLIVLSLLLLQGTLGNSNVIETRQEPDRHKGARANEFLVFVGADNTKAFFTLRSNYGWQSGVDYCQVNRMFAASIDSQNQNDIAVAFLSNTQDLPPQSSFWLPATDFQSEGTFTWIRTNEPVTYSNWDTENPSMNRTRNCVVLKSDGKWTDEECSETISYYPLCEIPLLNQPIKKETTTKPVRPYVKTSTPNRMNEQSQPSITGLIPIGGVGTKLYFKDENLTLRKINQALTFCHEFGMRLVTPNKLEEEEFLIQYALEMSESGQSSTFLTSGTNMLTPDCTKTNSMFRWFYTGEEIGRDNLYHGTDWTKCVMVTPTGFYAPDCIGILTWTMCEANTDDN